MSHVPLIESLAAAVLPEFVRQEKCQTFVASLTELALQLRSGQDPREIGLLNGSVHLFLKLN